MDKISHWLRIIIAFTVFLFIYVSVFGAKEGFEMYSYWSKSRKGIMSGPHFTTGQGCKPTVYANITGTVMGCQVGKKPDPYFDAVGYILK